MIKILKHGIRYNGQYIPCWYSYGGLISKYPEGTISVYCKDYCKRLPAELNPINDSDPITDYCETDRARILPDNPLYGDFLKHCKGRPA